MATHRIRQGLDLPIAGEPDQKIHDGPTISRVAVMGDDSPGVRARMAVAEGDRVKRGQLLFEDRTRGGRYVSPGEGRVAAVFRGARRMLRSVVIQLSEGERAGRPGSDAHASFEAFAGGNPEGWRPDAVRALLVESGLWTALRARPFSRVPEPDAQPHALFVTAVDTQPLAPDPQVVIAEARDDFQRGLRLLAKLHEGTTYLCTAKGSDVASGLDAPVQVEEFTGPHPAGNPGVHIHTLAPVSQNRSAWYIGYQDVIAVGRLFASGQLPVERVISLAGPAVKEPRLLRTRFGASIDDLTEGQLVDDERGIRTLSGSVLSGKKAVGPEFGFLGRYHLQVSALAEGNDRRMLGWMGPGFDTFSTIPIFLSKLLRGKKFAFTTDTNGSHRAMMPIGTYERVMPMDIVATYLLRSLVVGDAEQAVALGALELDEEDIALCTFVCPGKTEFGPYLRKNLERIEKEG
ncbi:MAG: Na(+)-translocating NADH-quinone reductase subunit A [Proteobacteria bacterium]|nr:Na(+)-translocating NADH-quinone reductase subunit A [Pseudomonadota bacterium]